MLKFFIKHKKVRGVITVFMTLIYLSVYLLIGMFVDGGRVRMAQTVIEDVQQVANENLMSQYDRGLYEYYGLFGISNYEIATLSNAIKKQIEETVGLKFSENTIKNFVLDTFTFGKDVGEQKSLKEIQSEIADSYNYFNPYGLGDVKVDTKYIDLTDQNVFRAQIRDEMRYKAALVLGANFFEAIKELMRKMNSINTVKNISEKIKSNNDELGGIQKDYFDEIDKIGDKLKDVVKKSYDNERSNINSVNELGNIVYSDKGKLYRYCEEFDKVWQEEFHGDRYMKPVKKEESDDDEEDEDEEVEYVYDFKSHQIAVNRQLAIRKNSYITRVKEIENEIETLRSKVEETIKKNADYREAIGIFVAQLKNDSEKVDKEDSESKKIYANNIEIYLRQWNDLIDQNKKLKKLRENIAELLKADALGNYVSDVGVICEEILNEITKEDGEYWKEPEQKLENLRYPKIEKFHECMCFIVNVDDSLETLIKTEEGEERTKNIFDLLAEINKTDDKDDVSNYGTDETFGKIKKFERSNNKVFNPYEYNAEKLASANRDDVKDLSRDNIFDKINTIMGQVQKMMDELPKKMLDNIYDEAYIVSHCRDFAHTYMYGEKKIEEEIKKENNKDDFDKVLNPKFIRNCSETEYLTDSRLKELQNTPAEIEYILWGDDENTRQNVTTMYVNIFLIRLVLNYIAVLTSPNSIADVVQLSAHAFILAPVVFFAAPLIYALPKAIMETNDMMYECKKINLWNGGQELTLYSAISDGIWSAVEDAVSEVEIKIEEVMEGVKCATTNDLINEVKSKNQGDNRNENVYAGATYLQNLIKESYEFNIDISKTINKMNNNKNGLQIKIGYTDHLLLYLFFQGMFDKKGQISRLQDIVENNMKKDENHENFELRNTYSQVSIESNTSVEYKFMGKPIMERTFGSVKGENFKEFPIKTKTAFAY